MITNCKAQAYDLAKLWFCCVSCICNLAWPTFQSLATVWQTCIIGDCEDASQLSTELARNVQQILCLFDGSRLWETYPPDLIGHLDICLKLNESSGAHGNILAQFGRLHLATLMQSSNQASNATWCASQGPRAVCKPEVAIAAL